MNINRRIQVLRRLATSPCPATELGLTAEDVKELEDLICRGRTRSGAYYALTKAGRNYLALQQQEVA